MRSRRGLVGKVFFAHYGPHLRDKERRAMAGQPLRGRAVRRCRLMAPRRDRHSGCLTLHGHSGTLWASSALGTSWTSSDNGREGGGRMAGPIQENLRFDLAGGGVKAQLITGGPAGSGGLALDLELQGKAHTFVNNEIVVERTDIGTLVSVVLGRKLDSLQTDFSLLIPGLIVAFDDPEQVTVVALRTGFADSPPGPFPPHGQLEWHTPVELKGTAAPIRPAPPMPSWQWSAVETVGGFLSEVRVRGTCEVPRPGYVVRLRRAAGQDGDPGDLRLQLTVYEPTMTKPQHPTTIAAEYLERTCRPPETVTILPNGVSIPVEQEEEIYAPPSDCDDWTVTLDRTSDPRIFELNVEATCPPGEEVEFQPPSSRPPGANPDHLWLEEVPVRSTTAAGQTPSPVRVRYRRRTRVAYTKVIILPGGPCLPVTRHHGILNG